MAGLAVVGIGVCCGLPVLLGAGALGTAAGIVAGSTLVAVIGLAVAAVGFVRWRHRRSCPADHSPDKLGRPQGGD